MKTKGARNASKTKTKASSKDKRKSRGSSSEDDESSSTEDDDDYYEEEESEEEEEESDEEEEESEDSEERTKELKKQAKKMLKHEDIQRIISKLIPSKYMKERVKNQKETKNKKIKRKQKKNRSTDSDDSRSPSYSDDEAEEDSEESEEYIDGEDSDSKDDERNIILLMGDEVNEEEEYMSENDDDDCNSDDEEMFMKESYEKIIIPASIPPKKKKKQKNAKKTEEDDDSITQEDITQDYKDMCELKKDLTDKLNKKPKNKCLIRAIRDCDDDIKVLVRGNRIKNAKKYHKLIHNQNKFTNEVEYFKTKMTYQEQMRIMNELRDINKYINIDKPYRIALLNSQIPQKFKAIAFQKLNVLKTMEPGDPEYYKLKQWVDAFMRIPFNTYKSLDIQLSSGIDECSNFIENAKNTLDNCVYGLNDAKIQIMQMMGQWITNPTSVGTTIAIKGPMGTGKTTLVKEGISKILNRDFEFIALGGNSDASFLEGHSYTYEGSSWGRIVQIIMDSKCMNPVIYFDELDKISDTPKGEEIIGILTHLTDTTQNSEYHDKYFSDISFDLSRCLFIFSYNDESKINPILRDRMYRIQTNGYDSKEKIIIARKHLLPKIREQVCFNEEEVIIPDETIQYIVSSEALTQKEDGVRNLKRCLEIIYTKLNLFRLVKSDNKIFDEDIKLKVAFPFTVTKEHVDVLLNKKDEKLNASLFGLYI
jgi:ATP-dependent Lon protease